LQQTAFEFIAEVALMKNAKPGKISCTRRDQLYRE